MEKLHKENSCIENPHKGNPVQINTDKVIIKERNTKGIKYQSINLDGCGSEYLPQWSG